MKIIEFIKSLNQATKIILSVTIVSLILLITLSGASSNNKDQKTKTSTVTTNSKDFSTKEVDEPTISIQESSVITPTPSPIPTPTPTPTVDKNIGATTITKTEPTLIPTNIPTLIPQTTTPRPTSQPRPTLTPTPIVIPPTGVNLSATLVNLYPGELQQITSEVDPDNASNKTIIWSSDNSNIASVDSNGLIKAVSTGTAIVTATTINKRTTKISVVIKQKEPDPTPTTYIETNSINLNVKKIILTPSKRQQVTVVFTPNNTSNKIITWSTNNSSVATITGSGLITALNSGTATITATTANGKVATADILVVNNTNIVSVSVPTTAPTNTPAPTINPTAIPTDIPEEEADTAEVNEISSDEVVVTPTSAPITNVSYFSSGLMSKVAMGYKYWLYIPKNTKTTTQMPLVIYLHGAGERGSDLKKLLKSTQIPGIINSGQNYNAIIVAPQSTNNWGKETTSVKKFIDYIVSTYNIDKTRIAITGHSLGAYGSYLVVAKNPGFFSCFVPVSTAGISSSYAKALAKTKIWAFHGTSDTTTSPKKQTSLINAVAKAGGDAKITLLQGKGHAITRIVYLDNDMINWMIQQKK